jgi:hypothetical protein
MRQVHLGMLCGDFHFASVYTFIIPSAQIIKKEGQKSSLNIFLPPLPLLYEKIQMI